MKSYVWVTFAFMGLVYYEASGGAEFEPEPMITTAQSAPIEPAPDVVARADTTNALLAVSAASVVPQVSAPAGVVTPQAVTAPAPAPAPTFEPDMIPTPMVVPVIEEAADIRRVASSRVNMRMGPSTNFEVITTLAGGTEIEVLSVDDTGWANVSTVELGIEGWIAERLLTPPES